MEHRSLLMRANRLLGAGLIEHSLVKFEDLEPANERLLELLGAGEIRQASVLAILSYERKVLKEDDVINHAIDDQGIGAVDLRNFDVADEIRMALDLGECWATWTIPYDREEEFHFVATAYYLSTAVREHWEKKLGRSIIWQATSMEVISEYLDKVQAERDEIEKATGVKQGSNAPQSAAPLGTRPPAVGGTRPPMPIPAKSGNTASPFGTGLSQARQGSAAPFPAAKPGSNPPTKS
jgi:hypothetical protein